FVGLRQLVSARPWWLAARAHFGGSSPHFVRVLANRAGSKTHFALRARYVQVLARRNDASEFRAGSTRWNSSLAQPLAQTLVCAVAYSMNALAQNKGIRQRLGRHQHITSAMALHSQASRIRSLLARGFAQMACQGNLAIQMAPPLTLRSSLFMARCGRTFRGLNAPLHSRPRKSGRPQNRLRPAGQRYKKFPK